MFFQLTSSVIWSPSGISILGPLLFIIYLNDLVSQIIPDSNINLFVDDIDLYRVIRTAEDYIKLHTLQATSYTAAYWFTLVQGAYPLHDPLFARLSALCIA